MQKVDAGNEEETRNPQNKKRKRRRNPQEALKKNVVEKHKVSSAEGCQESGLSGPVLGGYQTGRKKRTDGYLFLICSCSFTLATSTHVCGINDIILRITFQQIKYSQRFRIFLVKIFSFEKNSGNFSTFLKVI